jgi:hypothetical protein
MQLSNPLLGGCCKSASGSLLNADDDKVAQVPVDPRDIGDEE